MLVMKLGKGHLFLGVVLVCGFATVFFLSTYLERNRPRIPESFADSDLALHGKRVKGFAMGSEGLLADWYWMWSLQYIGGKISNSGLENLNLNDMTALNPRLLYPLLDNATDLDPKLIAAYSYGATLLPTIDANQAVLLTEKGIRDNPDNWRLLQYLGYIHWQQKDFEKAAEAYERGARVGGAPAFFKLMAARMKTQAGSRETAREIYSLMLSGAEDQQTQTSAELRLMELDSLDERDAVDLALRNFREANGRCIERWSEILPALASVELPHGRDFRVDAARNLLDPSGAPYRLDRAECKADLDLARTKIPLH